MKRLIVLGSLLGVFLILSGCGSEADDVMKDQLKLMNDWAEAMERNAPESRMKEIEKRMEALGKRAEKLKLSDDEKKKLEERYKDDIEKTSTRLQKAMMTKMGQGGNQFGMPPMPGKKG